MPNNVLVMNVLPMLIIRCRIVGTTATIGAVGCDDDDDDDNDDDGRR